MNSVFKTYSSVYGIAMMHDVKKTGDAATAKVAAHGKRSTFLGRLIGR